MILISKNLRKPKGEFWNIGYEHQYSNHCKKRGIMGFNTREIGILATPQPINKTEPTGGVHKPILRLRTIIIPKCTGSSPICETTTGRNIGVKMSTAGVMSIKIPTNSRIRLIMRRIITWNLCNRLRNIIVLSQCPTDF